MMGPCVCVVTPFHNTAEFLEECIESVLLQTFSDFVYILADNASTDGSTEIAKRFAEEDSRIRFTRFDELLPQVENYNRALKLIPEETVYCKVVQADDFLLPECLRFMVALAESDKDISVVGAYTVLQDTVFLDGLDYSETVLDGNDVCRRYFRGGPYLFGTPTTHLYRLNKEERAKDFYETTVPFEDADAVVSRILGRKMGFVHQVLTFVRTSNESISSELRQYYVDALTRRVLLERYGYAIFCEEELSKLKREYRNRHYRILGEAKLFRRPRDFFDFHENACRMAGLEISARMVRVSAVMAFFRAFANLENVIRSYRSGNLTIRF